jgi:kynurenine formamidase
MTRRLFDLSGPIHPRMWHYRDPYFPPEIEQIPQPNWLQTPIFSEMVRMPLQTGSYVETSAHAFFDDPRVMDYPLERTTLLRSVCVALPTPGGSAVTGDAVEAQLNSLPVDDFDGMGLIIGTGWGQNWDEPGFTDDCPFLDDSVIDLVLELGFSLLGGDTPRFENPQKPSGHLGRLFGAKKLILGPLMNVLDVGTRVGELIASPLNIPAASATPCRPVFVGEEEE